MYEPPGQYFQDYLRTEVRPRQNYLYEEEEIFLCTYANTLLYKKQKWIGMLNPYAYPFYPSTDYRTEINVNNTRGAKTEKKDNIFKTKTDHDIVENIQIINQADTSQDNQKDEEWKEYKNTTKSYNKYEEKKNEDHTNLYGVVEDMYETEEEEEEQGSGEIMEKEGTTKEQVKEMNYDVEKMSLADMDNVLLECIKGDTTEDDGESVYVIREAEKALESEV